MPLHSTEPCAAARLRKPTNPKAKAHGPWGLVKFLQPKISELSNNLNRGEHVPIERRCELSPAEFSDSRSATIPFQQEVAQKGMLGTSRGDHVEVPGFARQLVQR